MQGILEHMGMIHDPRNASYIKHKLSDILFIVMCGVLSGLDTLSELTVYAHEKEEFFKKLLGIETIPSKATFGRILSMLDGKEVGDAILGIMRSYAKGNIIAVDGKAIRSTGKSDNSHSTLQILSAYLTESGVVIAQESIHEKTNEIPVFQRMLTYLDVKDKIITADAMHCQRNTSQKIVSKKGQYVFGLKENQPGLLEDVRLFFTDATLRKECEIFQTVEKNAGTQVARIEQRVCNYTDRGDVRGQHSEETSYYISSLDTSAKELSNIVREHWKIESMHWLLDVTFSEDSSQFLSENAQKTMNSLRKFALAVHKRFLATSGKKRSLKANMLAALISPKFLLDIIDFL